MKNYHDVQKMFSSSRDAKLWEDMYPEKPLTFEQYIFSSRRDDAVKFVATHHKKEHRILDLGCGTGPFTGKIIQKGYQCLATDYSIDILKIAQGKMKCFDDKIPSLIQSDAQYIPFADESFDVIICLGMISYVPERSQAISEIMRILKPGGSLYLTFRNRNNPVIFDPANWLRTLMKNKALNIYAEKPGEFLPGSFLKPKYMLQTLQETGFNLCFKKGIGRGPLKINGKILLPHSISIALDRLFARFLNFLGLSSMLLGADVVIYVCQKPVSASSE